MSSRFTKGGCHCGNVRIEVTGEPIAAMHCHCVDCQKITGAAAVAVALFPPANVNMTKGAPDTYTTLGESGEKIHRTFCGVCGSLIMGKPEAMPGFVTVMLPALDDSSFIRKMVHIYTDHIKSWTVIPKDAQQFRKMPLWVKPVKGRDT